MRLSAPTSRHMRRNHELGQSGTTEVVGKLTAAAVCRHANLRASCVIYCRRPTASLSGFTRSNPGS